MGTYQELRRDRDLLLSVRLFALSFLLVGALGTALAAERPAVDGRPEIRFSSTRRDFGIAARDDSVLSTFCFENTGNAELLIEEVVPACGCRVTSVEPKRIRPGGQGILRISVETGDRLGPQRYPIRVRTNDPDSPEVELEIIGTVAADIGVSPRLVDFGDLQRGARATESLRIFRLESTGPVLGRIDSSARFLSVGFRDLVGQRYPGWETTVAVDGGDAPEGRFAEVLTLHLAEASGKTRKLDVPVVGRVASVSGEAAASGSKLGGTMAFVANLDGNWDLYLWTVGKGEPKRLTETAYDEKMPALSPQGDTVAYTTTEGRILLLDFASGEEQTLDIDGWSGKWDMCAFSPNGSELACTYLDPKEGDKLALAKIDIERKQARLVMGQFGPQFSPAWSPTGSQIAYAYAHCSSECGRIIQELWVVDADGKEARQLALTNANCSSPRWSPDGSEILFSADITGDFDIWKLDLETKSLTQVTVAPGLDESPAFGPEGKHVAFVSNRSGRRAIWLKALESGQLTELEPFGQQAIEVKDLVWR
jgi:TolB protein